jgi:transcriptional regulator with XRE-family HTH domain
MYPKDESTDLKVNFSMKTRLDPDYTRKLIRRVRQEKNLSIAQMSSKLGYRSQTGYQRIEDGTTALTLEKINDISEKLNIPVHKLLGLNEPPKEENELSTFYKNNYLRFIAFIQDTFDYALLIKEITDSVPESDQLKLDEKVSESVDIAVDKMAKHFFPKDKEAQERLKAQYAMPFWSSKKKLTFKELVHDFLQIYLRLDEENRQRLNRKMDILTSTGLFFK